MTLYIRYTLLALAYAVMLAVGAMGARADTRDEYNETFRIAADTQVIVKNTNGNISIISWNNDYAEVHAELSSRYGQDEIDLVAIEVRVNGSMTIETVLSRREGGSLLDRLFGSVGKWPRVDVNYTIKLPRSARLDEVTTVNGTVELENTRGTTYARTTNGRVHVDGHIGGMDARSTNGNIIIRGEVALRQASTTNGSIEVEIADDLREPAEVETVNGSVDLYIPDDMNVDLEVKTVNGSINANGITMRLDSVSKNHLTGIIGNGGPRLSVRTVNGSVDLKIR